MHRRGRATRRIAAAALFTCVLAAPAGAQRPLTERQGFYLGLNAAIGGVTAFVRSLATADPDPGAAFVRGALGGAVMYGGQRIVGSGEDWLRLPGVQVVAIGANMARNAGDQRAFLHDLTLPLYPFYIDLAPDAGASPVRLSALAALGLVRAVADSDRMNGGIDWRETLLTGAPVFRSDASWIYPLGSPATDCFVGDGCAGAAGGMHRSGTTWYTTGGRSPAASRAILRHESIHLTQFVRDGILHAVPASDAALRRIGGPAAALSRWIVLDIALPISAVEAAWPSAGRIGLYEKEANVMAERR